MNHSLVIGAGGLLGSAVIKILRGGDTSIYKNPIRFEWANLGLLDNQFRSVVKDFFRSISFLDTWEIFWVAGISTMSTSRFEVEYETTCLRNFINIVCEEVENINAIGVFGFASSAGAIYSKPSEFFVTEDSPLSPCNPYGSEKLNQELLLSEKLRGNGKIHLFIARFSTLYGLGQSKYKSQGLISHIARCAIRNIPVRIFVPIETSRDYIFADDSAREFVLFARFIRDISNEESLRKIIAAESSVSIAEIIKTFEKFSPFRVRVIYQKNQRSLDYPLRIAYTSLIEVDPRVRAKRKSLVEGCFSVLNYELLNYYR